MRMNPVVSPFASLGRTGNSLLNLARRPVRHCVPLGSGKSVNGHQFLPGAGVAEVEAVAEDRARRVEPLPETSMAEPSWPVLFQSTPSLPSCPRPPSIRRLPTRWGLGPSVAWEENSIASLQSPLAGEEIP